MPAYSSKELIVLLKNLTRQEKTSVRKKIKDVETNIVIKYIWKDDSINERQLNSKLKKFKNSKSSDAEDIIKQVLECIAPIIQTDDDVSLLLQKLVFTRFLIEKHLHRRALKHIIKIKKKATQIEQFDILLQAQRIQLSLLGYTNKQLAIKSELIEDMADVISYWNNDIIALKLGEQTEKLFLKLGLSASSNDENDIVSLLNELESFSHKTHISFNSLLFSQNALVDIYRFKGEYEKAIAAQKVIIDECNSKPILKKSRLAQYVQAIVNYCNRMLEANMLKSVKDLKEIEQLVKQLKQYTKIPDRLKQYLDGTIEFAKFSIYKDNWELDLAIKQIPKLEANSLPVRQNQVLDSIHKYEFAVVHFYKGNYEKASQYLNSINNEVRKIYPDLYLFSRILALLLLIFSKEKVNISRFKSNHDALRKAIAKANHSTHFEKALLSFCHHYYMAKTTEKKAGAIAKLKNSIPSIKKKSPNSFMFFDPEKWIAQIQLDPK